jgi:hypothetical protein
MANISSHPSKAHALFRAEHLVLSDNEFVSTFNTTFSLPQQQVWQLATVPIRLKLDVFETLRGEQLELQQWRAL